MALVVFLQEDEDVLSVYRNLKIFCETAPSMPLATIALLCKQTTDNFRSRPPPELPMAPSIG